MVCFSPIQSSLARGYHDAAFLLLKKPILLILCGHEWRCGLVFLAIPHHLTKPQGIFGSIRPSPVNGKNLLSGIYMLESSPPSMTYVRVLFFEVAAKL
jgi:hypothetical protein